MAYERSSSATASETLPSPADRDDPPRPKPAQLGRGAVREDILRRQEDRTLQRAGRGGRGKCVPDIRGRDVDDRDPGANIASLTATAVVVGSSPAYRVTRTVADAGADARVDANIVPTRATANVTRAAARKHLNMGISRRSSFGNTRRDVSSAASAPQMAVGVSSNSSTTASGYRIPAGADQQP